MANQVRTDVVVNIGDSFRQLDLYEKKLSDLAVKTTSLGVNPTFGGANPVFGENLKTLKESITIQTKLAQQEKFIEQAKRATLATQREQLAVESAQLSLQSKQERLLKSPAKAPSIVVPDAPMKAALADIKNYEQSAFDIRKQNSAAMLNLKKAETQVFTNEAKAQTRAFKAELSEIEKSIKSSKQSSSLSGGLGIGSLVGGVAIGVGIGILKDAKDAAFDAEKANRLLSSSATQAGLSYQFLTDKAQKFADEGGLSDTAADKQIGLIARLADKAGKSEDFNKIQTALLDTASARGLQIQQLETVISAVISGSSDEPLNAIGLADPGKLAADYAKSIGKVTDALTPQEQVLSRLNPLLELAAVNTGANADRMQSLSGQAEKASANIDNLYTNLGQGFTQSVEFRDFLSFANVGLELLVTNAKKVRKELSEGATPEQLAARDAKGSGRELLNAAGDLFSPIGAGLGFLYDATQGKSTSEAVDNFFSALGGTEKRFIERRTKEYTAESNQIKKQTADALAQKSNSENKNFAGEFQSKIDSITKGTSDGVEKIKIQAKDIADARKLLNANLSKFSDTDFEKAQKGLDTLTRKFYTERASDAEKRFSRNPNSDDAKFNLAALNSIKNQLPEELYESFSDKLNDFIKDDLKKADDKIKEIGKNATDAFGDLYAKSNNQNPFVSIFSEADKSLRELRENIKGLPEDLRASAIAMQQSINATALFSARLDNNLGTFDFRERAGELRNFKPRFDQSQADEIARRNASYGGFFPNFGGTFGSDLANKAGGFDKLTDKQKRDIYQTSLLSQSPFNSLSDFGAGNQKSLISALASEQLRLQNPDENLSIQQRLQKQLDIVNSLGAKTPEEKALADRKILSLSGNLRPEQLTDNLRNEIASVNEREAQRREAYEREAQRLRQEQAGYQKRIADNGDRLLEIAKTQGYEQVVRVIDDTNGGITSEKKPELKKAPTADATKNFYFNQLEFQ